MASREVHVHTGIGKFQQIVQIGPHRLLADEPIQSDGAGGDDTGPAPHELLGAALASCKSMTAKVYADRKGWPLTSCDVRVTQEAEGGVRRMHVTVAFAGNLDAEQKARLLEIVDKCPVHKTLSGTIEIRTSALAA